MKAIIRHSKFFFPLTFLLVLAAVIGLWSQGIISLPVAEGQGQGPRPLSGYAWSSNIGWISAAGQTSQGGNYGVKLLGSSLEGYAWSSNIGWIKFGANGITGPDGSSAEAVIVDPDTKLLNGWARACSVFTSGCTGGLKLPDQNGGWDGWISLSGTAVDGGSYGVSLDDNELQGYAWGSDVVGWIDFCGTSSGNGGYCVKVNNLNVTCKATPNNAVIPSGGEVEVDWSIETITGGNGSYTYCWGNECPDEPFGQPGGLGGDVHAGDVSTVENETYDSAGTYIANLGVIDSSGSFGSGTCNLILTEESAPNPRTLTARVERVGANEASGTVTVDPAGSAESPSGWTTSGCANNDSPCTAEYDLGDRVDSVMAEPGICADPNDPLITDSCVFAGWEGGTCSGSDLNCGPFMMSSDRTVIAKFSNPFGSTGDPEEVTLTFDPAALVLGPHPEGQPLTSGPLTITASSDGSLDGASVCLESFTKTFTNQSIYQLVLDSYGEESLLRCHFGNGNRICVKPDEDRYCGSLEDDGAGNYESIFKITVPRKMPSISGSYNLLFKVNGENLQGEKVLRFVYAP